MKMGWDKKKLGEVCSFLSRGISPKYVDKGGVVVINQRCIRDNRINFEFARRHDITAKRVNQDRFVQVGDVLVNSTGEGTLGRVAQLPYVPISIETPCPNSLVYRAKGAMYGNERSQPV